MSVLLGVGGIIGHLKRRTSKVTPLHATCADAIFKPAGVLFLQKNFIEFLNKTAGHHASPAALHIYNNSSYPPDKDCEPLVINVFVNSV